MQRLLESWSQTIWFMLFLCLTAFAAATRASVSLFQWPQVTDLGPASPFMEPALMAQSHALIGHLASAQTPLVYQSFGIRTGILPYADVKPRRWQAAPARPSAYHVVWLEQDARLRSALIGVDGETIRGPIDLASSIEPDFATLALFDGSLLVFWLDDGVANTLIIDSAGRPGPDSRLSPVRLAGITAALDQSSMVHVAWLASPAPGRWDVRYQVSAPGAVRLDSPSVLHTLTLSPGESLTTFRIGLDRTHGYLFLGTSSAEQPDVEHVRVLSFQLDSPAAVSTSDLLLPDHFTPSGPSLELLYIGRMDPVTDTPSHPAALRWPRPAPGQHAILPLAVSLRTLDGWRPGIVYFQAGDLLGFQVIAPLPADSGPPSLLVEPSGDLHLAWVGLDGTTPRLFSAHTGGKWLAVAPGDHDDVLLRTLGGALTGCVLGLAWLALPACVLLLAPRNVWALPLVLALYGAGKLLWPPELFTRLPPLLAATGIDAHTSPDLIIGSAVLVIGFVASGMWYLARGHVRGHSSLVYLVADAVLTWAVFGANVVR